MRLSMSIPIDYMKCETNVIHASNEHAEVFTMCGFGRRRKQERERDTKRNKECERLRESV